MIEVEVKLKVNSPESVIDSLGTMGYTPGKRVKETDIYFNGVDRDFRQTDEALRIRQTQNLEDSTSTATVTYKGKKLDTISMSRQEIEVTINSFDKMRDTLIALGYKPVMPVIKFRQYYTSNDITICLDNVEGLGTYVEIEVLVENTSHKDDALIIIEQELHKLGFSMKDTTTTSYLSMLEKIARDN